MEVKTRNTSTMMDRVPIITDKRLGQPKQATLWNNVRNKYKRVRPAVVILLLTIFSERNQDIGDWVTPPRGSEQIETTM